jgi:hypothetical protein
MGDPKNVIGRLNGRLECTATREQLVCLHLVDSLIICQSAVSDSADSADWHFVLIRQSATPVRVADGRLTEFCKTTLHRSHAHPAGRKPRAKTQICGFSRSANWPISGNVRTCVQPLRSSGKQDIEVRNP